MACCKISDKTVNMVFLFIFNCSVNLNWVCVVSKKTMRFGLDLRTCRRHVPDLQLHISGEIQTGQGGGWGGWAVHLLVILYILCKK